MLSSSPGLQIFLYSCFFHPKSFPVYTLLLCAPRLDLNFSYIEQKIKMMAHFFLFQVLTAVLTTIQVFRMKAVSISGVSEERGASETLRGIFLVDAT